MLIKDIVVKMLKFFSSQGFCSSRAEAEGARDHQHAVGGLQRSDVRRRH